MRKLSFVALLCLPLAGVAAACSSSSDDVGADESFANETALATRALQILGAQKVEGAQQQCNKCHDINRKSLRVWGDQYKSAIANLNDANKTPKEKINAFRLVPANPRTPYTPQKLGFLAAGIHIPDLPESKLLSETFNKAYGATKGPLEYRKLRDAARMPISPEHDRMGKGEFKIVKQWVDKGMPKLDDVLIEIPRPETCTPSISPELKAHVEAMRTKGWAARNKEQAMPMFACPELNKPELCFTQKNAEGKEIFPDAASVDYAKTWAAPETTVRLLGPELPHETSFWSRNSADGRFMSSGGGEEGAFVVDFETHLKTGGKERREIAANASYDPSFMPDNSGWLIQGNGTHYCTQDLLTDPATKTVNFQERQCSSLDNVALYQSVGRRLADNQMSDYFIVNNTFESDDGYGSDAQPTFGEDQKIAIKVMISLGESGYKIGQIKELPAQWEGDTMMSPTTQLLASRISGENGQLGYSIRKLSSKMGPDGYTMDAPQVGRLCIPGGKANFSFDERFLVTHHYLTRADFATDAEFAPYKDKNTSDIYIVDLMTGETTRATKMAPGQLALFPHYRSDGWLYFHVRDSNTEKQYYAVSNVSLKRR